MCDCKWVFARIQTSLYTVVCHNSLWLCPDYLCWLNHSQYGRVVCILLLISASHHEVTCGGLCSRHHQHPHQVLLVLLMSFSEHFRLLRIWFVVCASQNRVLSVDFTALQGGFTHFRGDIFIYLFISIFIHSSIHFVHIRKINNNSVFLAIHTYICPNPLYWSIETAAGLCSRFKTAFINAVFLGVKTCRKLTNGNHCRHESMSVWFSLCVLL